MIFEAFDVEDEIGCPYDNLTVYDGTNASAHQLGNYCGTRVPKDIITSSNIVFIVFKSDDSVIGKGFKINFKAVNREQYFTREHAILNNFYCQLIKEYYPFETNCQVCI